MSMFFRKKLPYIVAVVMALAMAIPAFAEDNIAEETTQPETVQSEESQEPEAEPEEAATDEPALEEFEENMAKNDSSSGEFGDGFTWSFAGGVLTISGSGAMPNYDVNEDEKPWADYEEEITKVVIGEGITTVGDSWFSYCTGIEEVQLPSTLKKIGVGSFRQTSISEIVIPNGVTELEEEAFAFCRSLSTVQLPSTLKVIGTAAFFCDSSLTAIQFSNGLEKIGNQAFVEAAIETISIPSSVKYIGLGAFYNAQLTSVSGLGNVEFIGFRAFDLDALNGYIQEGTDMVIIGGTLWSYNGTDSSVTVPEGVTAIGDYAFTNLTGVYEQWDRPIAEFDSNTVLESVTLPSTVKYIGEEAFSSCESLTEINTENVTSIEYGAFMECSSLTSIDISSAEYLGNTIFFRCDSLQTVNYSSVCRRVPDRIFLQCDSLVTVNFLNSIDYIGEAAFNECTKLTTFPTLNDQVTIIPESAFGYCYKLQTITIPDSVEMIDMDAFTFCKRLTSIEIPASVTTIDTSAFYKSGLKEIIGHNGTEAQKFAKRKGIKFINLEYPTRAIIVPQTSYRVTAMDKAFNLDAYATDGYGLKYKSSNKKVAKVSNAGKITIKKVGKATITITEPKNVNGKALTKKVKIVIVKATQTITTDQDSYTVYKGDPAFSLGVTRVGNGKVTYSTSNKKIATVSKKGIVTIKKAGTVKITIKAAKTSKCKAAKKVVPITILSERPEPDPEP